MIENPPRMAAEFSPRLRAIAEYASDKLAPVPARNWLPPISPWLGRRCLLGLALLAGWAGSYSLLLVSKFLLDSPTDAAARVDALRARSRGFEEQAERCRARAEAGEPADAATDGNSANSPQSMLGQAKSLDIQAARFRAMADIEERRNQGYRLP